MRYLSSVFRRSEIARHFGESDQLTARVAKRANYDVRPEPRPALPQPPSLVLEASFARSDVELHRWFAILDVDFNARGERIEAVLQQFLDDVGRSFDDLARGNLVDHRGVQLMNP